MTQDQAVMLFSAALIGGGLVYLGWNIGQAAGEVDSITNSPLGRLLTRVGA